MASPTNMRSHRRASLRISRTPVIGRGASPSSVSGCVARTRSTADTRQRRTQRKPTKSRVRPWSSPTTCRPRSCQCTSAIIRPPRQPRRLRQPLWRSPPPLRPRMQRRPPTPGWPLLPSRWTRVRRSRCRRWVPGLGSPALPRGPRSMARSSGSARGTRIPSASRPALLARRRCSCGRGT